VDYRTKGYDIEGEIARFNNERVFYGDGNSSNLAEGWYFRSREGLIGPYPSRSLADRMVRAFVQFCGTSPNRNVTSSHSPINWSA
jgi:hypothetical protein